MKCLKIIIRKHLKSNKQLLKSGEVKKTNCDTCNTETARNMLTKHSESNKHTYNLGEKTVCHHCKKLFNSQEIHSQSKTKCRKCRKIVKREKIETRKQSNNLIETGKKRSLSNYSFCEFCKIDVKVSIIKSVIS